MVWFLGDDWSDEFHDVVLMDEAGEVVMCRRLPSGLVGIGQLEEMLGGLGVDPSEVMVGIETDQGLWVEYLLGAGFTVFAPNPKSVARYRERRRPGGGKTDRTDARVLADMVRTDSHVLRPLRGNSPEATAIRTLARAHWTLVGERTRHGNRLRATLKGFYPVAVATFEELTGRDALAVLAAAPTPSQGERLTPARIRRLLEKAGRQRNLDAKAAQYREGLTAGQLSASAQLETASGAVVSSLVAVLSEINRQIAELETALEARFRQHPDAAIYLSLPGAGLIRSVRMLGEFGDDPERYADAKSRRNYAATSPIVIASGKREVISSRWIRNDRLHAAVMDWAWGAITQSPGARAYYEGHRRSNDDHHKALRALANRLVGILHGCLRTQTLYDENQAWGHRMPQEHNAAA